MKDGHRNGQGTYIWPNGDKYVGEFLKSKQNGKGTFFYANKEKFVGEWSNDKELNGIMYSSTGEIKCTYKNGVKIE